MHMRAPEPLPPLRLLRAPFDPLPGVVAVLFVAIVVMALVIGVR